MPTLHRFKLPITTEQDLRDFICYAHGVKLPDVQVCPNHTTPWRAFADAYFAKSSTAVWKASRGFGGKTSLLGLLSLVEAETLKATVSLLGGSGEQSERVLDDDHIGKFLSYQDAPRHLLESGIAREMTFVYGNWIKALMASQASVRGPHPQRLRLDEVDEMDLQILDAATGQPMMGSTNIPTQTVMSSTHQNADGTMTEVLKRALMKSWLVYPWCYRESLGTDKFEWIQQSDNKWKMVILPGTMIAGWLKPLDIENKRNDVTDAVWNNEYELQDPNPESRAIQPSAVTKMFDKSLGEYAGGMREYIEVEAPQEGATYATGADWAKKKDWTIIITLRIDTEPYRLVCFERLGRESWDAMLGRFQERIERYPGTALHDATGLGDVLDERVSSIADGFIFTSGKERAALLNEYCVACERSEIVSPLIRWMEAEHRLASVDDVYGSGHLPDTISAGALAYRAAHHGRLQVYL